jgi:hypothetical protein
MALPALDSQATVERQATAGQICEQQLLRAYNTGSVILLAHQLLSSLPTSCGLGAYGPGPEKVWHTTMSYCSVWGQKTVKSETRQWTVSIPRPRVVHRVAMV